MNTNRPRAPLLLVILVAIFLAAATAAPGVAASRTVHLPAGSVDGLAAAIEKAGPGGMVLVMRGVHFESSTVEIRFPVSIVGKTEAIIEFDTAPSNPGLGEVFVVDPALHIRGADFVTIRHLELRPAGPLGNTAILIEDAAGALIESNTIGEFQTGILIHQGDGAEVTRNVISASPAWKTEALPGMQGIVNLNGKSVQIRENHVSGATLGIFASDEDGHASGNVISDSYIGLILSRAPMNREISGALIDSWHVADGWEIQRNLATNSSHAGYMVADGACFNELTDNAAWGSAGYDLELLGASCFLGVQTPTSFENVVTAGLGGTLLVQDCGETNHLDGGALQVSQDACETLCRRGPRPPGDPDQPRPRTREQ